VAVEGVFHRGEQLDEGGVDRFQGRLPALARIQHRAFQADDAVHRPQRVFGVVVLQAVHHAAVVPVTRGDHREDRPVVARFVLTQPNVSGQFPLEFLGSIPAGRLQRTPGVRAAPRRGPTVKLIRQRKLDDLGRRTGRRRGGADHFHTQGRPHVRRPVTVQPLKHHHRRGPRESAGQDRVHPGQQGVVIPLPTAVPALGRDGHGPRVERRTKRMLFSGRRGGSRLRLGQLLATREPTSNRLQFHFRPEQPSHFGRSHRCLSSARVTGLAPPCTKSRGLFAAEGYQRDNRPLSELAFSGMSINRDGGKM